MSIDNNKITGSQFMFSVACLLQASSLLTAYFLATTQQDSWMVVLAATLIYMPLLAVLLTIIKRFPDKNLIQVNHLVFGKVLGKIVSVFYLFYFLTIVSLNCRDLGFFVQKTIMHNTPETIILLVFVPIIAWTVRYGIDVVTRYNSLFSAVSLLVAITGTILLIPQIDLSNFLPMLQLPLKSYVQGTHIVLTIPFGELVIFLMITPTVKAEYKKLKKLFFWGIILGGSNFLLVVFRDISVLGSMVTKFSMPAFESLRLIAIAQTLSRMEILFATVLIVLTFSKIAFMFYSTALAIAQIFNLKGYRSLLISLGVIVYVYSFIMYESSLQHAQAATNTQPFLFLFFEFILPIVIVLTALIRKLKTEKGAINLGIRPIDSTPESNTSSPGKCASE